MSTIKISELTPLYNFNSNTSNTLFVVVDLGNNVTQQISYQTLLNQVFGNVSVINFSDGTIQSTNSASFAYSTASYNQANAAYSLANTANSTASYANNLARSANTLATTAYNNSETNLTQIIYLGGALNTANVNTVSLQGGLNNANANIISLQAYSNAAFAKANSALANTNGAIFGGNLSVTGTLSVGNFVNPQKGFVYTPNVQFSTATLTIDFTRDSLIKTNSSSGLIVTLTNFYAGKEVILWFTNSAGSTQSVTHGGLANNSTVNSTSFSMPSNSTAYLRYFSIDGTLSNTFVAVTHA